MGVFRTDERMALDRCEVGVVLRTTTEWVKRMKGQASS